MPKPTLLNTRPSAQAAALASLLEQVGFHNLFCPGIRIMPLKTPTPCLADFDALFFVSANAVTSLADAWQATQDTPLSLPTNLNCFAIGKATAKALAEFDIPATLPSSKFDTQSLMADLSQQEWHGVKCLIVKGEGGLPDLSNQLKQLGAEVTEWVGYRRETAIFCQQAWQLFKQAEHPVMLASSLEAWQGVVNAVPRAERNWLFQQEVVAFSERIAKAIREQNWAGKIVVVDVQSNAGIVETLRQLG